MLIIVGKVIGKGDMGHSYQPKQALESHGKYTEQFQQVFQFSVYYISVEKIQSDL